MLLLFKVDQFEAELETLSAGTKKKKWKSEDNARQEECQVWDPSFCIRFGLDYSLCEIWNSTF